MKNKIILGLLAFTFSTLVLADLAPKSAAPDFTLTDIQGKEHKLSDFKGKWVVLEWFNKGCPFVKKHYGSGNMQSLQATYTGKGVVWLSIKSSAPGNQGYEVAADSIKTYNELKSKASYVLMDEKGVVGRLYGAKTTPEMFVISPEQKIAYVGAIDNNDSPDPSVIKTSKNYVAKALDSGMSGKAIAVAATKPYGCGVKY
jgi:peroxiredoxin